MSTTVEEFLEHHGIKGMKWGIRRDHPSAGSSSSGSDDHTRAAAAKAKSDTHGLHSLSNKEMQDLITRIHDYLSKIFGPLLKHIRQIIDAYRQLWNTYVKPIYDFLQRLRRVLVLFRLLGFKWAKQLDQRIVALENAITQSFLGVLANLNRLADWINFIIDPFGLIQPNVWLGSIAQSVGAMIGIVFGQMSSTSFQSTAFDYNVPDGYLNASPMQARITQRYAVGDLPDDTAMLNSLKAAAAQMGYTD